MSGAFAGSRIGVADHIQEDLMGLPRTAVGS